MTKPTDTLAALYPRFRLAHLAKVLDAQRFDTAWQHYQPLHSIRPSSWTAERTNAITRRLNYAPGTIRRDLACLRVLASWCVREGLMDRIPQWEIPAAPPPRQRYLTVEEMGALVDAPAPWWFKRATWLAVLTGQRIGAVLDLKWSQVADGVVDFGAGTVKRQKRRAALPITDQLAAALNGKRESLWVCYVEPWRPVRYGEYLREWRRVCAAAGIQGATPHCIRHGVATALVNAEVPLVEVSKMLGHSSTAITERVYAKFKPAFARRAMERMGGMLGV